MPAYGDSPFLEECLQSLASQRCDDIAIILATSTPSNFLTGQAARFSIPLEVNPKRVGIAADWNFALNLARSGIVTLAHHDDVFDPEYASSMLQMFARYPDTLIAFTDLSEHTPDGPRAIGLNVRIKRFLTRRAFGDREAIDKFSSKRRLLAWGNPVCAPSVAINRALMPHFAFSEALSMNLDWDAWLRVAELDGRFVYLPRTLVSHRVHPGSETSASLENHTRYYEDRLMFRRLWPAPLAALIGAVYRLGYLANRT